mgnify:CR=1 FL=1
MKASIKKLLTLGTELEVLQYEYREGEVEPHKYQNIGRKIDKVQTNSIRFKGGSWLEFGKASESEWVNEEEMIFKCWNTNQEWGKNLILTYKIKWNGV